MKTFTKRAMILAFILCGLSSYASIMPVTLPVEMTREIEVNRITNRLNEIKAMDKSTLTPTEKRALRKEVKEMRSEQRAQSSSGGVYLSVGAIIIIILLLIILL